jgi:benzoate transport
MPQDPRDLIDRSPMSPFQWGIVAIMVGLNALDGFDVLSISFASPGISAAWHIDRAALGFVLSMELIGMSVGSLFLGGLADIAGRRVTILGCLAVMAIGMFGASTASDIVTLCAWRVGTGIGIGGMLAATNAAVSEASNAKRRNLAVVLMAAGYPLGAIIGGSIAAVLLKRYDWHAVFVFGGTVTLAFIPLVYWRAPESIAFLLQRRGAAALGDVNRVLTRIGHATVAAIPAIPPRVGKVPMAALFKPDLRARTTLMALAYFAQITTFYFILKWVPKIVVDMGFAPSSAAGVLVWANVGGAIGSLIFGLLTLRLPVGRLAIGAMILSMALVIAFGRVSGSLAQLSMAAAAAGFFTNAGMVALYALLTREFPVGVRASATGFTLSLGRGGSALAPAAAGLLFAAGYHLPGVAVLMAMGSLIAAVAVFLLIRLRPVATIASA